MPLLALLASVLVIAGVSSGSVQAGDSLEWVLRTGGITDRQLAPGHQARQMLNLIDRFGPDFDTAGYRPPYATPSSVPEILVSEGVDMERALRERLLAGDRTALVPLVLFLVGSGCIERAEACMEGMGILLPANRRDLALAAAWFGRHDLYSYAVMLPEPPPDLEGDDYGPTIATVIAAGWMSLAPGGGFLGSELVSSEDLERLSARFPGLSMPEGRDWVAVSELDSMFSTAGVQDAR
ncbi:hypothetical protein GX411_02100 [Candidatus Fermentibacteria bacterium]|nr:hypothetical protein [Candidatus Fermentibacteria bacterium]